MAARNFVPGPDTMKMAFFASGVLHVKWAPHHAVNVSGIRFVAQKHVPISEMLTRRWQTRTDPFWWNCLISNSVGGPKATVRGWLRRRAAAAITESLRRKGYAKDGSRLHTENRSKEGDLVGAATFFVGPDLIRTSWKELQEKSDILISQIIAKTERLKSRKVLEQDDGTGSKRIILKRGPIQI